MHAIDSLWAIIQERATAAPDQSYSAQLLAKGRGKVAQKLGEEAVECVVAALAEQPENLAAESADLLYHLALLWQACGVTPDQVWAILQARQQQSGLAEKASRKP